MIEAGRNRNYSGSIGQLSVLALEKLAGEEQFIPDLSMTQAAVADAITAHKIKVTHARLDAADLHAARQGALLSDVATRLVQAGEAAHLIFVKATSSDSGPILVQGMRSYAVQLDLQVVDRAGKVVDSVHRTVAGACVVQEPLPYARGPPGARGAPRPRRPNEVIRTRRSTPDPAAPPPHAP